MTQKEIFFNYISENFSDREEYLKDKFQIYFNWLSEINQHINLISRKMDIEDYWTYHFLDSLLLTEVTQFTDESVLDFGTGGGLPGIPLAILYPEARFYLLDSRKKKLNVIADACELLGIDNVELIHGRVEEVDFHFASSFDAVVCRSVKIIPEFKKPLLEMITDDGKMFFYKSVNLDDMKQFKRRSTKDVSREEIGTRKIVTVRKK